MRKYLILTLVVMAFVFVSPYILAGEEYMHAEGTTLKFKSLPDLQPITMGYFSEEYLTSIVAAEVDKNEELSSIEDFSNFLKARKEYTVLLEHVDPENGSALYLFSARQSDMKLYAYVALIDGEDKMGQIVVTSPSANFILNQEILLEVASSLAWTGEEAKTTFNYSLTLPEGWNFVQRIDTMDIYIEGDTMSEETPTVVVVDYQTPMEQEAIEDLLSGEDWDGDKILAHEAFRIGELGASLFTLEETEDGVTTVNHGCFIFAEETTYFLMTMDDFMSVEAFKTLIQSFKLN